MRKSTKSTTREREGILPTLPLKGQIRRSRRTPIIPDINTIPSAKSDRTST